MPKPRDEENPIAYPPPATPPEPGGGGAPPPPTRILAPSRWNQNLWGNDPGDDGGVTYDRPDYTDGPYGPPVNPSNPADGGGGDDGGDDDSWSKKPRHLTIYGGRGYNEDGSLRDKPDDSASGGGGAGGSKASGSSSSSGTAPGGGVGPESAYDDLTKTIQTELNAILAGQDLPFGPEQLARQKQALFAATQGQAQAGQDAINRDLIRRGVLRSGVAAEANAGLQRAALQSYGQGVNTAQIEGAKENYNARMGALDRAQKHLDSYRSYILQKEMNEIERQKALDTIKLGYARIAADQSMLDKQLAAAAKRGGGGGGYSIDPLDQFLLQYGQGTPPPTSPF